MAHSDDQFTGTFAGEENANAAKQVQLTEQQVAIARYAALAEKRARMPVKKQKPVMSRERLTIILGSCIVFCIIAGGLLFKLSPRHSIFGAIGEYLLVATVLFVFALLRTYSRRR